MAKKLNKIQKLDMMDIHYIGVCYKDNKNNGLWGYKIIDRTNKWKRGEMIKLGNNLKEVEQTVNNMYEEFLQRA